MTSNNNQASIDQETHRLLIQSTATIVTALIDNGESKDIKKLIRDVYQEFAGLSMSGSAKSDMKVKLVKPRVNVEDSIQPDHIVCLEDGKKLKMLKRYLMTNYQMTPEQYRERWNLPNDYPMVAPDYAKKRSNIARRTGLGKKNVLPAAPQRGRQKARS